MRTILTLVLALAMLAGGCEKHDHDHDHDHGDRSKSSGGGHAHTAPHGGTLVELGDHAANVELVVNREAGKLTVYVLDAHAENAIRIVQPFIEVVITGTPQPVMLQAVASTLTGETTGDTSQFEAGHSAFKWAGPIEGRIVQVKLLGQEFKDVAFTLP